VGLNESWPIIFGTRDENVGNAHHTATRSSDLGPGSGEVLAKRTEEVFGFDNKSILPFFPELLRNCPQTSEYVHDDAFYKTAWVRNSFSSINHVCKWFGYDVVIGELAIVQDKLTVRRDEKKSMVNYVVCHCDTIDRVVSLGYERAFTSLPFIPPVNSTDFYEYAYICTEPYKPNAIDSDSDSKYDRRTALRRSQPVPTPSEVSTKEDSPGQIRWFQNWVAKNLGPSASVLTGTFYLAIPFHRVHSQDDPYAEVLDPLGQKKATPGGGLFLVLRPRGRRADFRESSLEPCVIGLQLLLSRATLTETTSEFGNQLSYNHFMSSMLHGSINAIRSIKTGDLCRALAVLGGVPPRGVEDLKDSSEINREGLVLALNQAVQAEDTAAAMLSFIEMNINDKIVRLKFQNQLRKPIRELIDEAVGMVHTTSKDPMCRYAAIQFDYDEVGPEGLHGRWVIPPNYLDANIIRGLFLELIRNAATHGRRDEDRDVVLLRVRVSPDSVHENCVKCTFTNQIAPTYQDGDDVVGGFLKRVWLVTRNLGCSLEWAKIQSPRTDNPLFEVTARLNQMQVEDERSTKIVAPVWELARR
jgi:hypothetical protein